jgi:hypothetical protein
VRTAPELIFLCAPRRAARSSTRLPFACGSVRVVCGREHECSGLAAGELYLATEWTKIPHPDKVETGGEDALFATPQAVGIADGVGGWAKQGIDAGEVSRALMASADALAAASPGEVDALSLLRNAWQRVEATQVVGSTTAVLASLVGGRLHTANLGDSGFVVSEAAPLHSPSLSTILLGNRSTGASAHSTARHCVPVAA